MGLSLSLGGKAHKLTIGSFPAIDLKAARFLADEAAVSRARGVEPAKARRERNRAAEPARDVFATVAADYIAKYARLHTRSWRQTERLLIREAAAWSRRRLSELTRADVARLLDPIAARAPCIANRTLSALQRLAAWSVERGIIAASPFAGIRPPSPETPRDRVLTSREIAAAWRAFTAGAGAIGDAARVLLLTGARLREVTEMTWAEVDLGARLWTLPSSRAKNGSAHQVPLSDAVLAVLAARRAAFPTCRHVFTANGRSAIAGLSKAKRRFDGMLRAELGKLEPWVVHDLRRTCATNLARLGAAPHIIEATLNHRSGTIKGVVRTYNRHPYLAERRAALQAWADALARITADAEPLALAA